MIPSFNIDGVGFGVLATGLILLAWSRHKALFLPALLLASGVMVISWLGPVELLALGIFVLPLYPLLKSRWGKKRDEGNVIVIGFLVWQICLFIFLRGYGPVDVDIFLNNPITVTGLSYILFRQIHMLIDAPDMSENNLTISRYLTYLLAFWTFLSGPIQRYEEFTQGLAEIGKPATGDLLEAGHRTVNGLIVAFLIAPLFLPTQSLDIITRPDATWIDFVILFYSFPLFLYLNFMGYTEVVIGVSRLCGMTTMPENFNKPFLARNIQNFWSRWHMSLTRWIGHYVFNPASTFVMRRTRPQIHSLMMVGVLFMTFLIVGMWHGTTINYLIFGMWHATGILITVFYDKMLSRLMGKKKKKEFLAKKPVYLASNILCVNYICLSMLFVNYSVGETATALKLFFAG